MATYGGRPNVSQFLRELNENPTALDDSSFAIDDRDMSMFTNTEFYDIETGHTTDFQPQPAKTDETETRTDDAPAIEDFSLDFIQGEFGFQDFGSAYTSPTISSFPEAMNGLQPIQPNLQGVYAGVHQQQQPSHSHYAPPAPAIGDKRKPEDHSPEPPASFEDHTRRVAEEDKRRRNTAASARFRVKKKQREQALEKSAKEMTDKVTALEGRIQQLETENKWLKNIVVEKNGGNEDFLAKLLDDYNTRNQARLKKEADEVSNLKAPTSPEEREAADSSG